MYKVKIKNGRNYIEIQGDKKFVNTVFNDIKGIFPNVEIKKTPKKRGRKPKPKPKIDMKNISIEELISKLDGRKDQFIVLVSGFILNKRLKKHKFRSKDMESFMNEHSIEVPKYLTYHFRKLQASGSFIQGKKRGRFKISNDGINRIQEIFSR